MSDQFAAIISGWTLTSGVDDLGEYIEAVGTWMKENDMLLDDLDESERETIRLMIQTQINRGLDRGDFSLRYRGDIL